MFIGRANAVDTQLTSPTTGKQCIYYSVRAQEQITKTEHKDGKTTTRKVWVHRIQETKTAEFFIEDPNFPGKELHVKKSSLDSMKIFSPEDSLAYSAGDNGVYAAFSNEELPYHVKAFLDRHNFGPLHQRKMRYIEKRFEIGEQVAILSEVKVDSASGEFLASSISTDKVTDELMKAGEWSDWDMRSWRDLSVQPLIMLTDVPEVFQVC